MNRISFLGIVAADGCNPNGDPAADNIPRQSFDGHGEISPDCIKRKIRNRVAGMGQTIFCQYPGVAGYDGYRSLAERARAEIGSLSDEEFIAHACAKWYDVRAFGQVFPVIKESKRGNVTISVRGPVSVGFARSLDVIMPERIGIATSFVRADNQKGKTAFGRHYIVRSSAYVFSGGIYPDLATKTGFSDADAVLLHDALKSLFDGDACRSRPEGSIVLHRLLWWEHASPLGTVNPSRLFHSIDIKPSDQYPFYTLDINETFSGVTLDDFTI